MKFFSTSLVLIYITIAALTVSMIWNFSNFQNNLKNVSFNVPQGIAQDVSGGLDKMMNGEVTAPNQKFSSPDEYFSFQYPATWIPVKNNDSGATSTEKIIFSASKVTLKSMSLSYIIARDSDATTSQEAIKSFKSESENGAITSQTNESEIKTDSEITIPAFESVFQIAQNGQVKSALNSFTAIILDEKKSYLVSIYGPTANWDQTKQEAEEIFRTIKINNSIKTNEPAAE